MKKRFLKLAVILLGGVAVLLIVLYASAEYTSRPSFCSTCHYMRPYVEAWKTSTHSQVTCTACHFPPGLKSHIRGKFTALSMVVNYFTGVYKKSKPWAEIDDSSCLRSGCHAERLLEGRVQFKEGIIFDHRPHLTELRRKKKLRCTSCHSQIVQGEHISVTESTCFLCHFKEEPGDVPMGKCTWCHAAPVSSDSDRVKYDHSYVLDQAIDCRKCHGPMQVGDGAVPVERCSSCHAEVEKIGTYADTDLIHRNHVADHKVECQICHSVIQHKSVSRTIDIMPECRSCHVQSHQAQLDLFSGSGGKNVPPHPNPMFEGGLNCQACHIFHQFDTGFKELSQTTVATGESCEKCHGKGYASILGRWEELMMRKVDVLGETFEIVRREVDVPHIPVQSRKQALDQIEKATFNFQLVKQGNVVHNVAYSDELLFSAYESLKRALKIVGSKTEIPDLSVYSKMVPSECKNCHYGGEQVTVEVFGINFSHNIHIVKNRLPCSQCHSSMRRHGELVVTRNECLSCHHTQDMVTCEKCHTLQAQIFQGNVLFATRLSPDAMYEEGVECRSCHEGTVQPIEKATPAKCSECHDTEYEQLFGEWQTETEKSMAQISQRLRVMGEKDFTQAEKLKADSIRKTLEMIEKDRSKGVHNMALIRETLSQYRGVLDSLVTRRVSP